MMVNENIELCDPLITHGIPTVSLYMTHGHSVKGGLVWYMDASKTNKTLVLGCIYGVQEASISSSLGFTPQYSRPKYIPLRAHIMKNVTRKATSVKCNTEACVCNHC
jgi:hypothetical protein